FTGRRPRGSKTASCSPGAAGRPASSWATDHIQSARQSTATQRRACKNSKARESQSNCNELAPARVWIFPIADLAGRPLFWNRRSGAVQICRSGSLPKRELSPPQPTLFPALRPLRDGILTRNKFSGLGAAAESYRDIRALSFRQAAAVRDCL